MTSIETILDHHGLELRSSLIDSLRLCVEEIRADEGTLWLSNQAQDRLIPVWNSGPNARNFVGRHMQPVEFGLVGVVFATDQCLCENSVYLNRSQDPTLDRRLGQLTCSMVAVPFQFLDATRGVVSCVRLKPAHSRASTPPFSAGDLIRATTIIGRIQQSIDVFTPGFLASS